jgi:hypothetical protein
MDDNGVAAQKHWEAVGSQQQMCGLNDNPGQFRESPLSALLRQAELQRRAQFGCESMDYSTILF